MADGEDTLMDRLIFTEGDVIADKYRVISDYEPGGNSNVYRCIDLANNSEVVIKCFRLIGNFGNTFVKLLALYSNLQKIQESSYYFCKFHTWFKFEGHTCIVMEKYGPSLYDILKYYKFQGWRLETIRQILTQIVHSLMILRSIGRLHGDLKPENILIDPSIQITNSDMFLNTANPQPRYLQVKLIDLESGSKYYSWGHKLITTIYYRAPEVILGLPWGHEIDQWSLGCIAFELYFGKISFSPGESEANLFGIQHMIGQFPEKMINECTIPKFKRLFENGLINPKNISTESYEALVGCTPLYKLEMDSDLKDLILKLLSFDPFHRPSLDEILNHPFLVPKD